MNPRPVDAPDTPTVADVDPTSGAVPLAWVVPAWVLACAVLETFIVLACRVRGIGMQTPAGIGLLAAGAFGGVIALQAFITQAVGRRLRRLSVQGSPSSLLGWEVIPAADDNSPSIVADIRPIEEETRRLRDALAQSERVAEVLAASAAAWRACLPHAVLELHRDGTIASCNPAASAMLGEAEGSLVGTKLGSRLEWPRGDELDRVLRDLIDSPGYRTQPLNDGQALRLLTAHGGSRHVRAEFAQARIQRGLQLVVVLTDVTELHRTQERQARLETEGAAQVEKIQEALNQERARAQAATRSKAAFLANMSHELRTPMNAIINLAQVARQGATGAQAATLGRVVESAQQLMDMLSDILQLARLESTSEPALSQIVDVHDCVIKVAQALCGRASDKGLELVPWFDANVPARIPLDEAGLRQVLMNLTGNALKFTAQGHVTVRVRRLPDGERGAFLRFEVSDTGIGIPQEILQRLGQPFEQAEQASNRTFGGTGLGLALTRRVLHRMHSELQARSQPNRGSTFWFDLRLPDGQIEDTNWGLASDFETSRVLVVNDLDDARAATTTHLDALGCRAQAVGSGTEALLAISHAEAAGQPFDICVLDAEMGDIEIRELAQRIRSLSRGMPPLLIALVAPGSDDKDRLQVPRDMA
ncbi:MAG: hypothetical protein KAY46_26085, partial [Burkholderiaceae bacterium]|nr:hypothetical protein [Burkholderiaceae bacterium]